MDWANCVLVKLSPEIALKTAYVRGYFVKKLVENIKLVLRANCLSGVEVVKGGGRLYLFPEKIENIEKIALALVGIFGVSATALCKRIPFDNVSLARSEILKVALECIPEIGTFAIRVKNSDDKSFSSRQFEADLGSMVLSKRKSQKVDLKNPGKKVSVEIGPHGCFVFVGEFKGVSGLPLGVEGSVAVFFEGKKEELLAAFLVMKRGCNVFPVLSEDSEKLKAHVNKLVKLNSFRGFRFFLEKDLKELVEVPEIAVKAVVRSDESFSKNFAEQKAKSVVPVFWPLAFFPKEFEKEYLQVIG